VFNARSLGVCNARCPDFIGQYQNLFLFFIILLLFSLVTLKSDRLFSYWWGYAKYAIPVAFILLCLINFGVLNTPTQGSFGWGALINQAVDFWASVVVYGVFVLGSLVQIVRGHRSA
jgi:hypothetical protein